MIKITRSQRKSEHLKWLKLKSEIPEYQYCGRCQHKKFTPPKSDYYIGYGIYKKVMRRRVYCDLDKRRSLDDVCMFDGLKVCGINELPVS